MKFGASTCTGSTSPATLATLVPYVSLTALANDDIDGLLHLGDISYNDRSVDLAGYRSDWEDTLAVQGYLDVLSATGLYATWDDHEVDDNWNPETLDPARIAAAKTAFFEALPIEPGPGGELYESFRWGNTLEVFVLDARSERKPSTRVMPNAEFVSPAQLAFIKEGLRTSPRTSRWYSRQSTSPIFRDSGTSLRRTDGKATPLNEKTSSISSSTKKFETFGS